MFCVFQGTLFQVFFKIIKEPHKFYVFIVILRGPNLCLCFLKRHFKECICIFQAKGLCFIFFKEPYKFMCFCATKITVMSVSSLLCGVYYIYNHSAQYVFILLNK